MRQLWSPTREKRDPNTDHIKWYIKLEKIFEKKLESLSKELEQEKDNEKQQNILKTINTLLETIEKMKGKQ